MFGDPYAPLAEQILVFAVQRHGMQEINTLIKPMLLLGWISMLAIIIPSSSGEKISFIVSLELAFIFMMASLETIVISPTRSVVARNRDWYTSPKLTNLDHLGLICFCRPRNRNFEMPIISQVIMFHHFFLLETFVRIWAYEFFEKSYHLGMMPRNKGSSNRVFKKIKIFAYSYFGYFEPCRIRW